MPAETHDATVHGGPCAPYGRAGGTVASHTCGIRSVTRQAPRSVAPALKTASRGVVDSIATRICTEVRAYAGPLHGRRQRLIREAVRLAVSDFVDLIDDQTDEHAAVDVMFRGIGYGLGIEGRGIDGVAAAFKVAMDDVWRVLPEVATALELSGSAVAALGRVLVSYLRHLLDQVQQGFLAAQSAARDARGQLALALLKGEAGEAMDRLAEAAAWEIPERMVVLVADLGGGLAPSDVAGLQARAPARLDGRHLAVVSAERDLVVVRDALLRASGHAPIAVSWSVRAEDAPHAYRWARRALQLRRTGRISQDDRVIDCVDCRMALLLEADPRLLEHVAADLLAPLLAEKPHHRLMLGETLARWLETKDSAPVIASYLGVHPQTVRNRMRRLRDLYGDALDDPQTAMGLMLALGASLPRWRTEERARRARRQPGPTVTQVSRG